MARSCKVAVVGAGVGGLVAARELSREGHEVVIFEKGDRVGGTWVYDPRVEADPLGLDSDRVIIHSSLYSSLRTNLPRQIMGFLDYPFPREGRYDSRAFPRHEEVLSFIEEFAREYRLLDLIRFGTEVTRVGMGGTGRIDEWVVETRVSGSILEVGVYEAVVVCNGHNTEPRIAYIPGIERWPGKQMHSHNYRVPEPFQGQVVVLIGNGPSAFDITRDISKVAKEVHQTSSSPDMKFTKLAGHDNIWQQSMIECVHEDGMVIFQDGSSLLADVIFYCTGYKYHYPFLDIDGIVSIDDNRVGPLYKHVFPPKLAPYLSFIGTLNRVIPFLTMELQSKWVSHVLSGKILLPTREEMELSVEEHYQFMKEMGLPKHHTHLLHPYKFEYKKWLVDQLGLPPLEEWREQMFNASLESVISHSHGYREEWDDKYRIQQFPSALQY